MAAPTIRISLPSAQARKGADEIRAALSKLAAEHRKLAAEFKKPLDIANTRGAASATVQYANAQKTVAALQKQTNVAINRAQMEYDRLRSSLGGAERAAMQMAQAQKRLQTAHRAGIVSGAEVVRLQGLMAERFSVAAVKGRDFGTVLTRINNAAMLLPGPLGAVSSQLSLIASLGRGSLIAAGAIGGVAALTAGLGSAIKTSIEFEEAFAGVRKTVDASEMELAAIEKALIKSSTQMAISAVELFKIAEAAGQLGIETGSIVKFSETIAKLAVTTDLTAEQAATQLSRFINIIGESQDDVDRLGSVLVELGNKFNATESEILDIGKSLASFGRQLGISGEDVMAWAATAASAGAQAEAFSSAMQKMALQMKDAVITGEGLEEFAKLAGVEAKELARIFRQDASEALVLFFEGLRRIEKQGGSTRQALDDLGLTDIRLIREFGKLTGSTDELRRALELARAEAKENDALLAEFAKRLGTTAAALKNLSSSWDRLSDSIGRSIKPVFHSAIVNVTEFLNRLSDSIERLEDIRRRARLFLGLEEATGAQVGAQVGVLSPSLLGKVTKPKPIPEPPSIVPSFPAIKPPSSSSGAGKEIREDELTNIVVDLRQRYAKAIADAQAALDARESAVAEIAIDARERAAERQAQIDEKLLANLRARIEAQGIAIEQAEALITKLEEEREALGLSERERFIGQQIQSVDLTALETEARERLTQKIREEASATFDAIEAKEKLEEAAQKQEQLAHEIANAFDPVFVEAIRGAESMGDVFESVGDQIERAMIKAFVTDPINQFIAEMIKAINVATIFQSVMSFTGGFFGRGSAAAQVTPAAHGIVGTGLPRNALITRPTLFPSARPGLTKMAQGGILAGEAGAEAVMPLVRTASGNYGVRAEGGVQVINDIKIINNTDAQVSVREKERGPGRHEIEIMIDEYVANAIGRGGKTSNAIEKRFGLHRVPQGR